MLLGDVAWQTLTARRLQPLTGAHWLLVAGVALAYLAFIELDKAVLRCGASQRDRVERTEPSS